MKTISVPHSLRETNTVNLALIGMSGAGKSYWSKKMEEKGYRWYNCDEMIAERLGSELPGIGNSTLNLAKWMGQPFSEGYIKAEKLYLELEEAVVEHICDELEQATENEPMVVDTTGSLIYLQKKPLNRLRALTKMIHLGGSRLKLPKTGVTGRKCGSRRWTTRSPQRDVLNWIHHEFSKVRRSTRRRKSRISVDASCQASDLDYRLDTDAMGRRNRLQHT